MGYYVYRSDRGKGVWVRSTWSFIGGSMGVSSGKEGDTQSDEP